MPTINSYRYCDSRCSTTHTIQTAVFITHQCNFVVTGFLHPEQAPTPKTAAAFPSDVPLALAEERAKTVVFFHDESTFHANEDQPFQWRGGGGGRHIVHAASKKQRVWYHNLRLH